MTDQIQDMVTDIFEEDALASENRLYRALTNSIEDTNRSRVRKKCILIGTPLISAFVLFVFSSPFLLSESKIEVLDKSISANFESVNPASKIEFSDSTHVPDYVGDDVRETSTIEDDQLLSLFENRSYALTQDSSDVVESFYLIDIEATL